MATFNDVTGSVIANIEKVIIGKRQQIMTVLSAVLSRGHVLLEDVPGVAKTMLARSIAITFGSGFKRIQCTPDLLPTDITGVSVFNQKNAEFEFMQGPIFTNILLADEINRATPRTQSALLEAMEERQVSVDGKTHSLAQPFFVLATQNPIEHEGTYPLPEAQVDRFMLKLIVTYPTKAQERQILDRMATTKPLRRIEPVMEPQAIAEARRVVDEIYIDDKIKDYVVDLVTASRDAKAARVPIEGMIQYGASPRATIYLTLGAKANAFLRGRGYVVPQDVKDVAMDVLRHRVILTYEAEAEEKRPEDIVKTILEHVPVP